MMQAFIKRQKADARFFLRGATWSTGRDGKTYPRLAGKPTCGGLLGTPSHYENIWRKARSFSYRSYTANKVFFERKSPYL